MESNASSSAIKNGLILGLIGIIITMLAYVIDLNLLTSMWFGLVMLVLAIVVLAVFGNKYRDEQLEGFISFGDAFKYIFIAALISMIVSGVFQILLYNVIDPELPEIITEQALKSTEEFMEKLGTPAEDIDEAMKKAENDLDGKFTTTGILSGSWVWLIISAIYALIVGAIIKKKRPEFE